MTTLLVSHTSALGHATPPGHPERADRIRAVGQALAEPAFAMLMREEAPLARFGDALICHEEEYVSELEASLPQSGLPDESRVALDADTFASPGSREAMLRAVGGAMRATDAVMMGEAYNAFVTMRPPGHHAEKHRAMGFCFFNNAAIAARHAQRRHGAERVAIIDWDVHHGNGTQHIFWDDPSVLFCSTHEMPLYPGSGAISETGEKGTIVNAPLKAGDDGAVFKEAFRDRVMPRVEAFAPDLIVISAGFDAHLRDPLANLRLVADDFAWATAQLMAIAQKRCGGRIVSVLEGGYDLQGLSESVTAHVSALMGR
ncbi:MAG: histone deacetylase family protein [Bosea sp. (in: a-proteobacteria)]